MRIPPAQSVKQQHAQEGVKPWLPFLCAPAIALVMPPHADVTAIVVTHDSAAVLAPCLAALRTACGETIVVDNASADATPAISAEAGARFFASGRNEGYGRANNRGAAEARSRFLLICNPDVTVSEDAVTALLDAARAFPEAGMWAPLIVEPDGRRFVQPRSLLAPTHLNAARSVLVPEGPACIPFASGACFMIERERFLSMGGFDRDIFLYFEDDDLCRRLMDAGASPLLVPAACVRHVRGRSTPPTLARRYNGKWHAAWSERHVRRKYGLPAPPLWPVIWSGVRAGLNAVIFRRQDAARYAGTVGGALAHRRGVTALDRQGLS